MISSDGYRLINLLLLLMLFYPFVLLFNFFFGCVFVGRGRGRVVWEVEEERGGKKMLKYLKVKKKKKIYNDDERKFNGLHIRLNEQQVLIKIF